MSDDEIIVKADGPVLRVVFNRPAARNALTWNMWEGLYDACERADADDSIRVMVLSATGGKAFVAGTDITQFADFSSGADGIAYEEKVGRLVDRLERVRVPTVAAVQGYCVGGGLVVAAVCDLRVATPDAKFGVPIVRTLGNCLAMNAYSLLVHHLGPARALDLLLRAKMYSGEEAAAVGFVAELCPPEELDATVDATVQRLLEHAPLSMWASKEAIRRLRKANLPDGDDLVSQVFGSEDFRTAVAGFKDRKRPNWTGH
ncbi:MAG: enoyl-CoA hydratase [Streptosporangiales bacterium]|nr:enoyl-CoA hydratase [Streptosporangiales bacterium]